VACFLCHVFQTLGHIFSSLPAKLQQKAEESMKIESKDTDTLQPSAARSFVFPNKKEARFCQKMTLFFGPRALRAPSSS